MSKTMVLIEVENINLLSSKMVIFSPIQITRQFSLPDRNELLLISGF